MALPGTLTSMCIGLSIFRHLRLRHRLSLTLGIYESALCCPVPSFDTHVDP